MNPLSPISGPLASHQGLESKIDVKLRAAATELEANFLAEMLKSAGLGEMPSSFGGGPGEDQFASFLRQEQAREMAKSGGIGLSEILFEALKERTNVVE